MIDILVPQEELHEIELSSVYRYRAACLRHDLCGFGTRFTSSVGISFRMLPQHNVVRRWPDLLFQYGYLQPNLRTRALPYNVPEPQLIRRPGANDDLPNLDPLQPGQSVLGCNGSSEAKLVQVNEVRANSASVEKKRLPDKWSKLLLALLVVSVCLNVLLAQRIGKQRRFIDAVKTEGLLQRGDVVPPLAGSSVEGQRIDVAFAGDRPTVVYVFSPACPWCDRNLENLRMVVQHSEGRFNFVGISVDAEGLPEYLAVHPYPFEVISTLDQQTMERYKIGGTPQTLVVDPGGKVLENWPGVYQGELGERVSDYFGVTLPGLTEETE